MVELQHDGLVLRFPEVHPRANLTISIQRTLRIPDDRKAYPLPPGLERFPLRHVDDFRKHVPPAWIEHGGVMLPMYQSEAMWVMFHSDYDEARAESYRFAVKIATGKLCAVSGKTWKDGIRRRPQNYVVVPEQPWLDGYCVEKGVIRQFVAMPLGAGYTAEEQVVGSGEYGGIQFAVYPMKRAVYEERFPRVKHRTHWEEARCSLSLDDASGMGLAPGGRMKQEIYVDPYHVEDWDLKHNSRCFVHIANSMVWHAVTGEYPPTTPPTAAEYTEAGLPWFEWYDDGNRALDGAAALAGMKSVAQFGKSTGGVPLPENRSVRPERVVPLRRGLKPGQVREWKEK